MHCKFPIFIKGTIALHVSGSFSAHHRSVISCTTALVQFYAETSEVNKGHWLCECNGVRNRSIKLKYKNSIHQYTMYNDKRGSVY